MTLEEYQNKFLGKLCGIDWSYGSPRKGATFSKDTINIIPKRIYKNCFDEILVEFESIITVPIFVQRIYLMEDES